MNDDIPPRVLELVEEALASGCTPEDVCTDAPELIPDVRRLWERCRRNEIELDELFSAPKHPPHGSTHMEGPGAVIGPYRLLQQIGEGAFGTVFMAEQSHPVRRRVALKVVKPGMDTREVIARFEAERQALALMDHPNIARVFDAGATDSGRPYFVMELVNGIPITTYCDESRLTARHRLELMVPVCRAVQSAHQKGVIHRDLKPSNVLVTMHDGAPVPKVIDFGIAKATAASLTDRTLFTAFGGFVGTPAYMSPEQAERSGLGIDTRTDVYGLGVLVYELLTGTTPLDPQTLKSAGYGEIARLIREADPQKPSTRLFTMGDSLTKVAAVRGSDPRKLGYLVRGELDWIVMKALEKDRTRRYDTAAALADDLVRYLAGEPVAAGPPGRSYRLRKFARRHRTAIGIAALLTLSLLLGVAGTTRGLILEARERRIAESRRRDAETAQHLAEQRRAEAEAERRTAQAVVAFLTDDVLFKASPVNTGDPAVRDTLVKAMIEPALRSVGTRFRDQPLVRAAVEEMLATVLSDLGRYDLALRPSRAAWEERQTALGDDNPQTIAALDGYAFVLANLNRVPEAEAYMREAWQWARRVLGEDDRVTMLAMDFYASVLTYSGKYAEAEPLARAAWLKHQKLQGDDDLQTIRAQWVYADDLFQRGDTADAEPLAHQAYDRGRRVLGDDHPDTLRAQDIYASILEQMGRDAEAEPLFRNAWERERRLLGDNHPDTARMEVNYAAGLAQGGHWAEAEPLFEQAWQVSRRKFGDDHPAAIDPLNKYAMSLVAHGRAAAEAAYAEAVAADRKAGRARTAPFAELLYAQADFLRVYNSPAAAVEPLREATDLLRTVAPDDPHRGRDLYWLGTCLMESGHPADAEKVFRENYVYDLSQLGPDRTHLRGSLSGLIGSLKAQGKPADLQAIRAEYRHFATTMPFPARADPTLTTQP